MLRVHFSNRIEVLAERLIGQIGRSGDLFTPDEVLIPHAGMQRWLTLAIADAQGICAQVRFGYLAPWLWQQAARLVPGAPPAAPPDSAVTAWRIHRLLGDADLLAAQPRLAAHLRHGDAVMRYELAQRVAALFDTYATYRPDWLALWRAGRPLPIDELADSGGGAATEDAAWQSALWRRLQGDTALSLLDALARQPAPPRPGNTQGGNAARPVHVFALPTLAPLHRALLAELARFVPVELYLLNPCQEFWFDLTDPRRLARLTVRRQEAGHEIGHRLLAAWGRQTQSQLGALLDGWPQAAVDEDAYQPNEADTLLARLQNSILDLEDVEPGRWTDLPSTDRSLEVHCCHSLTRELEVLHDRLLSLFVETPSLRPSDVVVVLPDLEAAAPLIDAVFGTVATERHIPYAISGRASSRENRVARALLELLSLLASRLPATELFGWMQQPLVARRFGWDDDDLLQLQEMLRAGGYRWGLDEQHRARLGLPGDARHTLSDALERIFLGQAVPDVVDEPFAGLVPVSPGEGTDTGMLGGLWQFTQQLHRLVEFWTRPQAAGPAITSMHEAVAAFLQPEDDEVEQLLALQRGLAALQHAAQEGAGDDAMPLALWRTALEQQLDDPVRGGVPTGRVTFTAMNSLRGLPFQVVCVLGLNDGDFPTPARPVEFDLLQRRPRPGDRQRAEDERNLFLDLLLAARHALVLSYTGRSVRDNAVLPPSVLLADLLDLLVPALAPRAASADELSRARERLVIEHPLQPFSAAAFNPEGDPRRRSFDRELARALRQGLTASQSVAAAAAPRDGDPPGLPVAADDEEPDSETDGDGDGDSAPDPSAQQPFFTTALPPPGPEWREVALQQLIDFFRNPSRVLLRRRLRIELPRDARVIDDDEPLVASARDHRALARRLLPALLRGVPEAGLLTLAQAGTEMPRGAIGQVAMASALQTLAPLAGRIRAATASPILPAHEVRLAIALEHGASQEVWQLHGAFTDLRSEGLVRWSPTPAWPEVLLEAWLHHLLLCAAPAGEFERVTRWLLAEGTAVFGPVDEPLAHLRTLMALYRRGLGEPLPLFLRSAWALIEADGDLAAAERCWSRPDQPDLGEQTDPAHALALRGVARPLDGAFAELAQAVLGPLRQHLRMEGSP